ncbi:MAG TPA: hypothetical protein ENI15_15890 [Spirochaetes bacterium]|nr:hypothetical protein [Spirochaetota bacterium]
MIIGDIIFRRISAELSQLQVRLIKSYVQGAVYFWCKNCKDENGEPEWFAARDLFGGENYHWDNTPLIELHNWHYEKKSDGPVNMAGRDIGQLLKDVVNDDKRKFQIKKSYTREYKWDGKS